MFLFIVRYSEVRSVMFLFIVRYSEVREGSCFYL